mmetsp:Transcript_39136/g.115982  ORF Transcript_39136/g.115982 Transcript_39136/m.115982 type:complete len:228 (-) Transcript_39136:253-936(-)
MHSAERVHQDCIQRFGPARRLTQWLVPICGRLMHLGSGRPSAAASSKASSGGASNASPPGPMIFLSASGNTFRAAAESEKKGDFDRSAAAAGGAMYAPRAPALLWWPELRWHCAEDGAFRDGSALNLCDGASFSSGAEVTRRAALSVMPSAPSMGLQQPWPSADTFASFAERWRSSIFLLLASRTSISSAVGAATTRGVRCFSSAFAFERLGASRLGAPAQRRCSRA